MAKDTLVVIGVALLVVGGAELMAAIGWELIAFSGVT